MPEFADIYVLSMARDTGMVSAFLEKFAASREETAQEYEIPQYSKNPSHIFRHADSLIDHCCTHPSESYGIYWRVSFSPAAHAMLFFLSDGCMIYGLSVEAEKEDDIQTLRHGLMEHTQSSASLIAWEQAPPDSAQEFMRAIEQGS